MGSNIVSIVVVKGDYKDVKEVLEFGKVYHEKSLYKNCTWDYHIARKTLLQTIAQNHMCLYVAREKGEVVGFIIGMTDQLFFSKDKMATDLVFIAKKGGATLLHLFKKWASKKQAKLILCANASGMGDLDKVESFYNQNGLTTVGNMYWRDL